MKLQKLFSDHDIESSGESNASRWHYLAKYWLMIKTFIVLVDQLMDIALIASLFILRQFWLAGFYLAADILPALIIMWHKFQAERSWKVLVRP